MTTQEIVQKLWGLCDVLRDDGITYHQYVTELTYILFLKMAKETGAEKNIPEGYRWDDLLSKQGVVLKRFYLDLLRHLGEEGKGRIKEIYANSRTSIDEPKNLEKIIKSIDNLDWYSAKHEGLGDLYEGLLQKNANEKKSGAGQYFTPRALINVMVRLVEPQPGERCGDPACGTFGFMIAADRQIKEKTDDLFNLKEKEQQFQRNDAFTGVELVQDAHRLALMNAMLHDIEGKILLADTLSNAGKAFKDYDVILTNPPFGTKKGGERPTRDDLTYPSSNKQLNFLQLIYRSLKPNGKSRAAVVLPDNVLFQEGDGQKVRADLMNKCNLHTILRLPTGIFYAQGVKTNVLFFTREKTDKDNTKEVAFYDMRTNMPNFGVRTLFSEEYFKGFELAYNAKDRYKHKDPEGRWTVLTREQIKVKGDNLDQGLIADSSVKRIDELADPAEIAEEAIGKLEEAVGLLQQVVKELRHTGDWGLMVAKKKEDTVTIEEKLKAALVPEFEQPYPIPEKWVWTKIGEISSVITGKTPRTADPQYTESDDLFFVTPAAFDMGDQLRFSDRFVANAAAQVAPLIPAKSTLLTSIGATLGKTAILEVPVVINQQINALVPRVIVPEFLFRWTCSQVFQEITWSKSSATTLPIINKSRCEQLPIPLAPLPEQQRITEKLESLLGRINEAKTLLDEIPEILQNFRQTVLAAACSGRLTKDWREKNLTVETAAELLHRVQETRKHRYEEACKIAKEQGTKKPKEDYKIDVIREKTDIASWAEARLDNLIYIAGRIGWRGLKAEEYTEDGPLFLSVYSLNYGEEVDFANAFHISMERYEESSEIQLQENDILLAKDGAGIGKIGIVRNLDRLATVNSSLLVIRSQEAFIPKFLFYFLSGPQLQKIARARITGSATPHLFQRDIKEFVLSIPPPLEQKEIVRRVESLFVKINDFEIQYKEAMERIETLPEIIISKAFRGELIPQDPSDESSLILLQRIWNQPIVNK